MRSKKSTAKNMAEVHEELEAAAKNPVDVSRTVEIRFRCTVHGVFLTGEYKVGSAGPVPNCQKCFDLSYQGAVLFEITNIR